MENLLYLLDLLDFKTMVNILVLLWNFSFGVLIYNTHSFISYTDIDICT